MQNKIFEYGDYENMHTANAQVCIIGSGCGGATLGKKLSDAGIDVLIVEQGGYYPSHKMDQNELNMAGKLFGDRGLGASHDGGNMLVYGNNVGGASVHYWADSYRTPPEKLELWANKYGILNHSGSDLQSAFSEIEKNLHIHEATDEFFNPINSLLKQTCKQLGWKGHRVPQARKHCQKSGHCMQGCLYDAKQSQMVTHIPSMLKQGGRLFADVKATKLNKSGTEISSLDLVVMDRKTNKPSNKKITVHAKVFVVAAGGFSSSYFLMQQDFAHTLPALGKYFSMNPSTIVHGLFEEDMMQWRNIPAAWGIDEFRLRRFRDGQYQEGGYLLMPNQMHPGTLAASLAPVGNELEYWMSRFPKIAGSISWIDDVETELGEIKIKSDGSREVYYPYGEMTQLVLKDSIRKQASLLFEAGAKKLVVAGHIPLILDDVSQINKIDTMLIEAGGLFLASPHPGGGCRMGTSKENSVVDSTHKVHEIENLYVSDSSVFPTSSSLDPSLTIMAFSHVAASFILKQFE